MITTMPAAYLRIVCTKIAGTGKFSVQEIFSFNGEKFLCANFFTEKQINEHVARKKSPEKTRGNGAEKPGKDRLRSISNQLAHSWSKVQTLNYATESPHCLTGKTDVERVQAHPPFYGNRPRRQQEGHLRDQQD